MNIKVRHGDTIEYYSKLFNINSRLIAAANNLKVDEKLLCKSVINIPGYQSRRCQFTKNHSLTTLAKTINSSKEAILLINNVNSEAELKTQNHIYVPEKINNLFVTKPNNYTYEKLKEDLNKLQKNYQFIKINEIGRSVLNKKIFEVIIGAGTKKVHFNGSFHANEWITTPILLKFINEYLLALTNTNKLNREIMERFYNNVQLSIVPMVNPDGVNLVINGPPHKLAKQLIKINQGSTNFSDWKANIRGIDLNNQFPTNWEIEKERKIPKSPAARDYPGDKPLTEPEATAMANLALRRNFDLLIALHTQGAEFYWGYEHMEPVQSELWAQRFEKMSSYKAVKYIDSHAGYRDWFIARFSKPGFTFELGKGINPLPIEQFNEIYEVMRKVFWECLKLK